MFPALNMAPANNLTKKITAFYFPHLALQGSNIFTYKTHDNMLFSINLVLIISPSEYTSELYNNYRPTITIVIQPVFLQKHVPALWANTA